MNILQPTDKFEIFGQGIDLKEKKSSLINDESGSMSIAEFSNSTGLVKVKTDGVYIDISYLYYSLANSFNTDAIQANAIGENNNIIFPMTYGGQGTASIYLQDNYFSTAPTFFDVELPYGSEVNGYMSTPINDFNIKCSAIGALNFSGAVNLTIDGEVLCLGGAYLVENIYLPNMKMLTSNAGSLDTCKKLIAPNLSLFGGTLAGFKNLEELVIGTRESLQIISYTYLEVFGSSSLTTENVDYILELFSDFDGVIKPIPTSGFGSINLLGSCGAPSAKGIDAKNKLISLGWIINTN